MSKKRVYHFLSLRHGLENIRRRRIKISTMLGVNDPFELLAYDVSNRALRDLLSVSKSHFGREYGMLCFSKSSESPVQWAHYADRHRGLCLGFDVDACLLKDVIYKESRVSEHFLPLDYDSQMKWVEEFLYTKYSHWSYEQEIRAFSALEEVEDGLYFKYLDSSITLAEVQIGFSCEAIPKDIISELGDLAEDVKVFKVKPAFDSFRMIKDERDT